MQVTPIVRKTAKTLAPTGMRSAFRLLRRILPPVPLWRQPDSCLEVNLDLLLSHYRTMNDATTTFVQVGAHDGISGDPIFPLIEKHRLRGILIEPLKEPFARLKNNYAQFHRNDFQFLNVAIASADGALPLYRIKPNAGDPPWVAESASFDPRVLMKLAPFIKDAERRIFAEQVACLTFESLFKQVNLDRIDILQIDAEGYDAELIKLFDVPLRKPAIISFEHRHLKASEHNECIEMLIAQGYKLVKTDHDTLAYRCY